MKSLLKKLLETLICSVFAGSLGMFFMHVYEKHHPREVEIVYVEREPVVEYKEVRVGKPVGRKVVRK